MKPTAERSYRGLLWGLVLFGTVLDQVTKYGVFKWLYNNGDGGRWEVVPSVFRLLAQYTDQREAAGHLLAPLRLWSGEMLPKVNQGALFGLAGEYGYLANMIFAVVSIVAAVA